MLQKKSGFTLAEVLMVVVVIGVLSALIIPRLSKTPEKAVAAEGAGILQSIRQAEIAYHFDAGAYLSPANAGDWAKLGLDNPNAGTPKFTYAVDGGTGTATATRSGGGTYGGTTILLTIAGVWDGTHPHIPSNGTGAGVGIPVALPPNPPMLCPDGSGGMVPCGSVSNS